MKKELFIILSLLAVLIAVLTVIVFQRKNTSSIVPPKVPVQTCPKFIDCMPSIGNKNTSCEIPKGCEGYTNIAY